MAIREHARSLGFLIFWLIHLTIANLVLSLTLLLPPSLSYDVSSSIASSIWRGIQHIFTRINGANIIVSGLENLREDESAIIISNHVEWTDFYMIQELAIRTGMLGRCRWFAKSQLKWVPLLGWGLWAMRMPLVSRNWTSDQNEMNRVFRGVLKRRWPIWLISFSESTRYTEAKWKDTLKWCEDHNKRVPRHTLYPRTRGFIACVQKLRTAQQVKAVYDVTVAYARNNKILQDAPSFLESVTVPRLDRKWKFYVHVDRYSLEDLPMHDEEIARWLEDRWVEKGQRLEDLEQKLLDGVSWDPS